MLPILVFFILKHFFYGYLVSCAPFHSHVDHSKRSLSCHPFDLVLITQFGFVGLQKGVVAFWWFIGLSAHMSFDIKGFMGPNFICFLLRVAFAIKVFGVNVDIFWFWIRSLCFFSLGFKTGEERRLLHFGDDPTMHLFTGAHFFFFAGSFIVHPLRIIILHNVKQTCILISMAIFQPSHVSYNASYSHHILISVKYRLTSIQ